MNNTRYGAEYTPTSVAASIRRAIITVVRRVGSGR